MAADVTVKTGAAAEVPGPAQDVVRASAKVIEVTDSLGRRITIRKLKPSEKMRIFKAIGPQNSQNQAYLGYAMLACSVVSINGEPEPVMGTEREIEAAVDRLGDEGLEAIGIAIVEHFGVQDPEMLRAAAKNSAASQS